MVLEATAPAPRHSRCWGSARDGGDVRARRFHGGTLGDRTASPRLVKLVVSATVTRDPSKLEQLQLHSPRLLSATPSEERWACCSRCARHARHVWLTKRLSTRCQFPSQLEQYRVVVPANKKPYALITLLHSIRGSAVLVFAASVRGLL